MTETLATYVARNGITVETVRDRGAQVDDGGWEHHAYVISVTSAHGSFETSWRQGYGVETVPSDVPAEILECLLCDASSADEPFEDWCADLGYDTDSRKAYADWQACGAIRGQLVTLLGSEDEITRAMKCER